MRHLEKEQLIIISAGVLLVLIYCVIGYFPRLKEKGQLEQSSLAQRVENLSLEEKLDKVSGLDEELKVLAEKVGNYDRKIPVGRNYAGFWKQITDVMNKYRLSSQLVKPGTEIHGEDVCCIPISIECSGRLEQIFAFCKTLDSFERKIRLEKVRLDNDEKFSGELKLMAEAKIYYRPLNSVVATGTANEISGK